MQNNISTYELNVSGVKNMGNMNISMYDIEEHLKQYRDSKHFDILYNCWKIEKKEYENRLSTVGMTYQTYSLHDATHSETILRQIAYFLGEERIRQLSPTDAWLILECAYCHDLGMVVTAKDLYRELAELGKEDFDKFAKEMRKSSNADVRSSWTYLEPLFEKNYKRNNHPMKENEENAEKCRNIDNLINMYESPWYRWPAHFTRAFMVLIQERCRPKHGQMSSNMIKEEAEEKSYEGLIPLRFRHLIAEIAAIHTDEREKVIETLSQEVQGFDGDYAHPRFVAELIRIGDLLDMDNNRFNKYQLAVAGEVSYNSFTHQLKHRALRDFLVTPEVIRVKADFTIEDAKKILQKDGLKELLKKSDKQKSSCHQECYQTEDIPETKGNTDCEHNKEENEKVAMLALKSFKELSGWLQQLHYELDFFCKNWLKIVPERLCGNCPYFEPEQLLLDGKAIENDLIDLRYHITAKRSSEIIEGIGLYGDIFVAVIREIIQNSMDAVKRKIYSDLSRRSHNDFKNPLSFYKYISRDMEELTIVVGCNTEEGKIKLKVKDYGIGITYKRLKEMQHIGDIPDYNTSQEARNMPAWWKPTGAFGIGMQAIFNFSKVFKLTTRTEEEGLLRKMRFHSTQIGGKIDSYIINSSDLAKDFKFGTEVEVDISPEMVCLLEKSSNKKSQKDFFGSSTDIFQDNINAAIKKITGSFGIPVIFIKDAEQNMTDRAEYLSRCFGVYYIDLAADNQNTISKVLRGDADLQGNESDDYRGFSCWSEENHVLLRYRWDLERKKVYSPNLYFNEIRVEDEDFNKFFHISFFKIEAYLFDKNTENFLQVNREKLLNEKREHIINIICNTHLKCLRFLLDLQEKENKSEEYTYKQNIWNYETKMADENFARNYLGFLINKEDITKYISKVKWFVQEEDVIRPMDNLSEEDFPIKNHKVWILGVKAKHAFDIRLRNNFAPERRYIVEDLFTCCMDLAITELLCMEEEAGDYTVLYKVNQRSGQFVSMSEEDFMSYIDMRYQELAQKNPNLGRIILPGIEAYRPLCVSRLVTNLGTMFEKKLDSAIIMPITVGELEKLLGEKAQEEAKAEIEQLLSLQNNPAYGRIVEYIKSHGVSRELDEEDIKNAYRKLLTNIWQELPRR